MRLNKFDRSYGSRKVNFVSLFVEDFLKELDALTVEFVNEAPSKDWHSYRRILRMLLVAQLC